MNYETWTVAPQQDAARISLQELGIPALLARVMAARGIKNQQEARQALEPALETLHAPLLMKDMNLAVARIRQALSQGELIAVYGDYDVDGITSTSLLSTFFTAQGGRTVPYIPHRMGEGYGLNREAVKELAAQGVGLIVTVDCGITAVEEVLLAKELGVDVVITDHHSCKESLPPAVAVVDPQRPDCPYPFKKLAGVGVALKLAMAIVGEETADAVMERYCGLAAIGTVADVMPMAGENRLIVSRGLASLNAKPPLGLKELIEEAGLGEKPLSTVSIGYTLAPRINAAGRMGQADTAVELLLTGDASRGRELAQELCAMNRDRQNIEGEILDECVHRLEQKSQENAILLADEQWHQGVVGIVASRLTERYHAPTFIVCLHDGVGKGSCRSWGGVNLFALLDSARHLLLGFGGHALAAGFTVAEENIPALAEHLHRHAKEFGEENAVHSLELDCVVHPEELTVPAIESLDQLEPCGVGNVRPAFMLAGVAIQSAMTVGRGRHLKLRLESRGTMVDGIWFSHTGEGLNLTPGTRVDVAFYPQVNEFRGARSPQIQVIDLRHAMTRAQSERIVYDKYCRGEQLTAGEAETLIPERDDFVRIWRYLKGRAAHSPVIEDTPDRIARSTGRADGHRETLPHTMVCLDVMEERGLITLARHADRLCITLKHVVDKVILEDSEILRRLHGFAQRGDATRR